MSTLIEAARMALEALEQIDGAMPFPVGRSAVTALRQALEQPADEPVREHTMAEVRCECCGYMTYHREHMGCIRASRPQPAAQWVGLTGHQKDLIARVSTDVYDAIHRTEANLKEKNS